MKQHQDWQVVSVVDFVEEEANKVCEVESFGESLAAVLLNCEQEEVADYDEVVAALHGMGTYSRNPTKLDLDLKNRKSPPAKPSIE